jgi:hypothetical protein
MFMFCDNDKCEDLDVVAHNKAFKWRAFEGLQDATLVVNCLSFNCEFVIA